MTICACSLLRLGAPLALIKISLAFHRQSIPEDTMAELLKAVGVISPAPEQTEQYENPPSSIVSSQ